MALMASCRRLNFIVEQDIIYALHVNYFYHSYSYRYCEKPISHSMNVRNKI